MSISNHSIIICLDKLRKLGIALRGSQHPILFSVYNSHFQKCSRIYFCRGEKGNQCGLINKTPNISYIKKD